MKKGFSLVELIVVIAIMAVLLGVVAPVMIIHVENAREQRDTSAMSEVGNAVRNGMLKDPVYDEAVSLVNSENQIILMFSVENGVITFGNCPGIGPEVLKEIESTCGETLKISSRQYKSGDYSYEILIDMNFPGARVTYGWAKRQ